MTDDIEISNALVETLAETLYEHDESSTHGGWYKPWADVDKHIHLDYVDRARAGIEAVVPLLRAQWEAERRDGCEAQQREEASGR